MANQWRYIGNQPFSANGSAGTVNNLLDALHTLGTKNTYYDGSGRTPGSGVAGTYTKVQSSGATVAVHATPATTSQGLKYIWAGGEPATDSDTPLMASPDTWSTGILCASINLDSGAYNAYDADLPFTSGRFFGYWRAGTTTSTAGTIYLYECALAVFYVIVFSSTNIRAGCLGKFAHVGSSSPNDSEADGNIYGVMTSGTEHELEDICTGSPVDAGNNEAGLFSHNNDVRHHHTGVFSPGTSIIKTCTRLFSSPIVGSSNEGPVSTLSSGKFIISDRYIPLVRFSSQECLGVLDGMTFFQQAKHGEVVVDTANNKDVGYVIGEHLNDVDEAWLLLRNES